MISTTPMDPYPVTPAQRSLLLQCLLRPDDASTNLGGVFRIEGEALDGDHLVAAMDHVLAASPGLATSFAERDGAWVAVPTDVPRVVLRHLAPQPDADAERQAVAAEAQARVDIPIHPTSAQHLWVELLVGSWGTYLVLVASHLVADATTFYVFARATSVVYTTLRAGGDVAAVIGASGVAAHPGTVRAAQASPGEELAALLDGVSSWRIPEAPRPGPGGVLKGRTLRAPLSEATSQALRTSSLVERHGLNAVLLAVHSFVTATTFGLDHVVVGVPVATREGAAARYALGYFISTLPLPVDLAALDWDSLCAKVAADVKVLARSRSVDVATLVPRSSGGGMRDFAGVDTAFTFYRGHLALDLPDTHVEAVPVPHGVVTYALTTTVEDTGAAFNVEVRCADQVVASRPLERFIEVLEHVLSHPDEALTATALVSPERSRTIDALVNVSSQLAEPERLDTTFRRVAETAPDAVALVDASGTLSYGELADRVNRWAAHLAAVPGRRVVVALPRGREQVVALLAILAAGKSYVPLDPAAPPERAAHILRVLTETENGQLCAVTLNEAGPFGADGMTVLRPADLDATPALPWAPPAGGVDDAAYVIFTSGSTGEPKGVEVTHRNVARLLLAVAEHVDVKPEDRWCLFHSVAFDFSVWEIFGSLLAGCSLVVLSDAEVGNPVAFADALVHTGVTVLNQTPSAFRRLRDVVDAEKASQMAVRWVIFGGEALYPRDLHWWFERAGRGRRAANMYGITETTVHTTVHEVTPCEAETADPTVSCIGRPLSDLRITVVDRALRQVPIGVPGEILVSGAGLARGYLAREALTAERFLTSTPYGERVYRTGDRAVVRPDGTLAYLGRTDHQVQLRGYRIELGEVETALRSRPGVADAVVTLVQPDGREPYIGGWLKLDTGAAVPSRSALAQALPEYMIPTTLTAVPDFPVTINGKVDIDALVATRPAAPAPSNEEGGTDGVLGRILSIYAEVIGVAQVRPDDGFFELGATSMHLVELHRRLTDEPGLADLTLIDLFENGSPRELARRVGRPEAPAESSSPGALPNHSSAH